MSESPKVSVVIPTMNEEESIGTVMDEINQALANIGSYEVMIVDTNSKDRTREIASSKGAIVVDEPRRGYGRAYKTGFAKAKGQFIATLDADCTYPASDIPKFVKMLESENLDFISGDRLTKITKEAMGTKHRFGNWMLNMGARFCFGFKTADSQTGMWVFRRGILPKLNLTSDLMALSEEIKIEAWQKVRYKEVPIVYSPRVGEVKLNTWHDGFNNLKFIFSKRFGKANKAKGEVFPVGQSTSSRPSKE